MADHDDKQDDADGEKHDEPSVKESGSKQAANGEKPVKVKAAPVEATAAVAHGGHGASAAHADHGLAHTTPVSMLVGILAALMVLTVLTVSVTSFDLGAQGNLIVAMVIATVKAGLVVAFFMHLVWDKKLHLILFLTSVLFLILFLSLSVNDRGEYQHDIDYYQQQQSAAQ
jgi:cytochrome c oxidase subunit 4